MHLLTGGFFFKTSVIITVVEGSLLQPEKNREIRPLQQQLKMRSLPPSHSHSPFTESLHAS